MAAPSGDARFQSSDQAEQLDEVEVIDDLEVIDDEPDIRLKP
jgi:hypothetical protein